MRSSTRRPTLLAPLLPSGWRTARYALRWMRAIEVAHFGSRLRPMLECSDRGRTPCSFIVVFRERNVFLCLTAELDWCPLLRVDSQVVDLVFAMEDMERGLQEMAQSVEHMQEMLKRSPMVQALAQRKPEVRAPSALHSQNGRRGLRMRYFRALFLYQHIPAIL